MRQIEALASSRFYAKIIIKKKYYWKNNPKKALAFE